MRSRPVSQLPLRHLKRLRRLPAAVPRVSGPAKAPDHALNDYLSRYRSKKSKTAGNTKGTMPPWSALTS